MDHLFADCRLESEELMSDCSLNGFQVISDLSSFWMVAGEIGHNRQYSSLEITFEADNVLFGQLSILDLESSTTKFRTIRRNRIGIRALN